MNVLPLVSSSSQEKNAARRSSEAAINSSMKTHDGVPLGVGIETCDADQEQPGEILCAVAARQLLHLWRQRRVQRGVLRSGLGAGSRSTQTSVLV